MDKRKFLDQLLVLQEDLGRRGVKHWPKEIQQRCAQMLAAGLISGSELASAMKVGIQTIYSWKEKYGRSGFKSLRVVSSSRLEVIEAILPKVIVNGFEVHLGSLSMGQLNAVLEGF